MLGKLNKALLFSCLCGLCFQLSAQQYGYTQYNSSSGAPFDKVSSVIQDQTGFVWIGSQNGLYRFEGIFHEDSAPEGVNVEISGRFIVNLE